jgi:hypothetical protein
MYLVGMTKPVKIMMARMKIAAGAIACASDLETEPMNLKNMDMTTVVKNEIRTKKKKAPASRRRFVMKYNTTLNTIALAILYGTSTSILAKASADGW